jgi:N12 class adenine-specific DNA methylase
VAKNSFLQSPFDNITPAETLPGQQTQTPQELPEIQQTPAADTRQPTKVNNFLPPADVRPIFEAAAQEFDVPVNVLMALGHQESRYNAQAIGPTTQWGRAKGMMQYLDSTAKGMGINPFAPEEAIPAAAKQIRERLDKGYSMEDAVKEHFAGPDRKLWGPKTDAYGREVMQKVGMIGEALGTGEAGAPQRNLQAELDAEEPGRYRVINPADDRLLFRLQENFDAEQIAKNGLPKPEAAKAPEGFIDRSSQALSRGYDNTVQNLATARFAIGAGGDSAELSEALAKKFAEEQKRTKTAGEKEIDDAFQRVTDAKGAWNTTVEGLKAIGTAITNPEDLAVGIIEQTPNMLPTLGAGAAGAGGGAAVGGVIANVPGAITGAIIGGRTGMATGTTATELGAEVEQMILERLGEAKQAPTAANIKSLLDDKTFQSEALERGLKKGLTVAAVDQIFFGLTGKVAGKAATATTIPKKIGLGTGAVALDATGEVAGEAASQKVARGEVDAGDALREGVYGLGQSVVETGISAAARSAKAAANTLRGEPGAPAPTSDPTSTPPTATAPTATPAPAAPAPRSAASGPLSRSIENAAENSTAEQAPPRVTVTAPEGQITGFMESYQEDGQGGFAARVLGDDGQVYQFTSADQVTISQEPAAPQAGPLTQAVEKAADETVVAPVQPEPTQTAPAAPAVQIDNSAERLAEMTEPQLRERLKYIADQAKASGGWNKLFVTERKKVEREINSRAKPVEQAADVIRFNEGKPEATALPKDLAGAKPRYSYGSKQFDLTFASDFDRAAFITAQKDPSSRNADYLNFAMQASGLSEAEVRAHGQAVKDAIKSQAKDAEPGTLNVPEIARGAAAPEATTQAEPARDEQAGKWFGSREKADAYIAKKNINATHEIVQTGKARFEIKPKEITDGNNQRTVGQPDGAEETLQQADAGQAQGAAVQSAVGQDEGQAEVGVTSNVAEREKPETQEEPTDGTQATQTEQAEAQGQEAPANTSVTQSPLNPEWNRFTYKSVTVDFATSPNNKAISVYDIISSSRRSGEAREALLELKKRYETLQAEGVVEDSAEAIAFWQRMLDEGIADKAVLTDGRTLEKARTPAELQPTQTAAAVNAQFSNNKIFTADKVEAARARLKSKLSQLNSGIDPEVMIDGMTIAGAYIEGGVREFSAYAKAMVADFGDAIKPYLLSFYEGARNYPGLNTEGMSSVDDAKRMHSGMITPADTQIEAVGEIAQKPAKRTKKTGAKSDMTLTQDWGVDAINGYSDDYNRETGNTVKDAFLKEARSYLTAVAGVLTEQGYTPYTDAKGRPEKMVSVNESGIAGSGEVTLTLAGPDGIGAYVHISESSLRGVVPTTPSGIAIMFRAAKEGDKFGGKGQNRWAPVDLSAADLAALVDKTVKAEVANAARQPTIPQGEPRNANTPQPEGVPAGDPRGAQDNAAVGDRNREQMDLGLAAGGQGTTESGQVPGSAQGAGTGGTGRAQQAGQQPPGETRDRAGVRAESEPTGSDTDFVIDAEDIGKGGLTKKYRDNVGAIRILKAMEAEGRVATPDERKQLAKYVGWGAMKGPFDPDNKQWAKQHAELKELLTDAEFRAARKSTLDAHYTSPIAVGAMYDAMARLGFNGGRVLEPSVGVGNFFGLMPAAMRNASQLFGVELDSLTSRMVAALYPKANVAKAIGFEDFQIPSGYFDAVIGNPPFGSQPLVDSERSPYSGFSIHNYFLAKGIDKLRPGGIMQVVVSHNFLDANDGRARKWISERADLIAGVRLPNTAFQENAGTQVVTDILIFQKREPGAAAKNLSWVNVGNQTNTNPKTGETATHKVNQFFIANPQFVLGTPSAGGTMYTANEYTVEPSGDLKEQLSGWVKTIPENVYAPVERKPEAITDMAVPDGIKVGSFYVDASGEIMQRGEDVMGNKTTNPWTAPNAKAAERMKGLIALREALRTQMRLERSLDSTEAAIEANRADLNRLYDAFLKAHGHINSQMNRRIFLDDTEAQLVQALEFDYDKGISKAVAEREGIEPREPSATKADIFQRRVAFPPQDFLTVSTAKDALLASLNYRGKVDMAYMAEVYGKTDKEIFDELGDVVYDDPLSGIVTADEYLSGDVKTKLAEAKAAGAKYQRNVEALEKVIPVDKKPSEISVSIGAAFVPADVYEQFVKHISGGEAKAAYVKATGQWVMSFTGQTEPALNVGKFGTDQLSAQDLFQLSMLGRGAVVKKTIRNADGSTTTILLEKETEAAREKQNAIKAEWQSWLWNDAARADLIASTYNDKMNRIVERKYDGSHMTFPGMNQAIKLLEHQKNGVWRGLQSYQVLYDHVVGAGKTFEMATLAMEMRRLGIARKPVFVVPNHLTLQWRSEFTRLYPGSNVLAATPEDFSKDNRERLFSKIITGDWDAVVIGHSSLKKIGLPEATEKAVLQEQIDEVAAAIEDMKRQRGDRNIIRDMEGIRSRLEARMKEKLSAIGKRSKVVTFDELGLDAMFVDEMHEFKNLSYNSTMDRNPGMGNPNGSAKAFDLFVKVRWLFDTFGEKTPFITATGTPVSNSLVEMYNMQRYMQYPTLKREGLHVFDAWAKQFGSVENVYEVAPSGSGYRQSTRFAKFTNLPGLMSLYNSFADTITLDDLKAQEEAQGKRFPVPKMVGGKPQIVVAQRSPAVSNLMGVPTAETDEAGNIKFLADLNGQILIEQKPDTGKWTAKVGESYLGEFETEQDARMKIVERAVTPEVKVDPESILGRFGRLRELTKETKGKVNALSLTGEANKAGLDYRLVNPAAPDFPGSKINLAVDNMVRIYKQWAGDKGTQLVFCDLSIPLSARASYSSKARRLYVRDDAGSLEMKRGTMHTLEGQESLPYFVVQRGEKDLKRFDVYDAASGRLVGRDFRAKQDAIDDANARLADENRRQAWINQRETAGEITQEAIDEYNNDNDIEADGIEAFTREDIAGVSGAAKFSVYDDIKAKLIAKGIPEREIAFIHDYSTPAAKDKLFKAVNSGEIRFLLGSTPKMGAGTNVQKRLVGLHHIDAPWRPSDLEQREGRIIRRGNELYERNPDGFEVFIGRYATEQTYDTRRWQILEHKARGIEQLRNFDGSINEIDDIEGEAANAADMKAAASGDPLILEETRLKNDVRRLEQLQAAHADDVLAMNRKAKSADEYAKVSGPRQLKEVNELIETVKKNPLDKEGFAPITVDGKKFADKESAQKEIFDAMSLVRSNLRREASIVYRGIEFNLSIGYGTTVVADSPTGNIGTWTAAEPFSSSGFVQRMANYANRLPSMADSVKDNIEKSARDAVALREQAKAPFQQAADLEATREEYKKVQRALLAKGPAVPESQKPAVAAGIQAQKARLEALGFGEQLREFFDNTEGEVRYSVRDDGLTEAEFGPVYTGLDTPAAIDRLMGNQSGEAIVSRPDLGEISLVYGNGNAGLKHITARHGNDILNRLPDLLANGKVYTKDGQANRVFIGNERDEAVIRLDWNGQAKTWLLSAYEKYPNLKAGQGAEVSRRSQTVAERTSAGLTAAGARQAVTTGIVGPVISRLIDNGSIVLHQTTKTLPKGIGGNVRGIQAVTTPDGKVHLVASAVTQQTARAVMLHEMFHKGGERLIGSVEWSKLMGRLGTLYRQSEQSTGRAREFFDRARARVAAAKRQGAVATRMEVEEFAAYAIEEYERAPQSLPAAIRKWVEDLIGLVKSWMVKSYGKQLGQVTPAQLAAFAKFAVMDMAAERRKEMFGPVGMMFSAADPINSPAFKRWFGKSKVVDANGKPLVVYHGSPSEFYKFDPYASMDGGFYFTGDRRLAESFSKDEAGERITLHEVYLSLQNPKTIDLRGEQQPDQDAMRSMFEQAKSDGHDGVVLLNVREFNGTGTQYVAFRPEQIKSAIGNDGSFDPTNPDIRYSVSPEQADAMIDEASKALDETGPAAKEDYIGRVVGDMSLGARLIVHPRTVAAVHPEFTPVYRTAISQMETRDEIIADLGKDVTAYHQLPQASKENVNKALELGRLTSTVFSKEALAGGVTNTGTRKVVVIDEKGKPKTAEVPVNALLSVKGEIIKLTDAEIAAYQDLRSMFDRALDLMRDQTLEELGFAEFINQPNAAKAIRELITDQTPADQAERLSNIASFVAEIEQAKRAGYVPFARYGDYVVTVKEKIADLEYAEDSASHLIVTNAPESFADEMLSLGAEQTKEGWRIKKSQKKDVERLTEQTVYSAKVETGLTDFMAERRAQNVDDIPAVKAAIEKARTEHVGNNPRRRIVAFKTREKKADTQVRLSDVDALAEVASIDNATWDAVRDKLADAIKARSFRKHFFHSDNVPGYTGDFERSISDYVIGMAGYLSRRQHMKRWDNTVSAVEAKPKLFQYASKYREYVNNPQEELAMVRQIGFFSYIAGVMATAFANLTQVPLMTVPTLSQVAPVPLVVKETVRAYKDAIAMLGKPSRVGLDMFDPNKAPADVREALKEAWAEGAFVPLETFDLMMTARQRNVGTRKGVKAFNTATQVVAVAFTFAERMNRLVTFIAAARLADKRAVRESATKTLGGDALARQTVLGRNWTPKNFAEWAIDESQYRMGKANRPTMMRGVGSAIMQFKGFMLQTFEAWYRMTALHGRSGKFAAASSIMALYAMAGLWGLPGAEDLRKLLEAIYKQITKKDLDLKTELRAWIARTSGSNAIGQIVSKGVSYPLGVDMTRVGMGNVVPDSPLAAAGIPFDMLIGRPTRAFEKGSSGDYAGAVAEFTPNFMKNMIVSGGWKVDGVRDKQGNRILAPEDLSGADLAMRATGFQPSIVTDVRDYEYAQRRQETAVDGLKRSYTNKIAKTIAEMDRTEDPEKLRELDQRLDEIYADIDEHNAKADPEQVIKIGVRAIRNRVAREMEGVKSTWGQERKAARGSAEELRGVFGLDEDDE